MQAIWLDDERDPTDAFIQKEYGALGDEVWLKSYAEFVDFITEHGVPGFISFDHDLGADENGALLPTGYDAAKWLVEKELPIKKFAVHSANPIGKRNIESLLTNWQRHLAENS